MRRAAVLLLFLACEGGPVLTGARCDATRPCPGDLFCGLDGRCTEAPPAPTETLSIVIEGEGIVSSDDGAVRCETTCEVPAEAGGTVTLEAHGPFIGWLGPCGGAGTCVLTMDAAVEVRAVFGTSVDPSWMVRFGGVGVDRIVDLGIDRMGRVLVGGSFVSTADFLGEQHASMGDRDAYFGALTRDGADFDILHVNGTPSFDQFWSVASETSGSLHVAGYVGSGDKTDAIWKRFDASGAETGGATFGSDEHDVAWQVMPDGADGVFLAGGVAGPLMVGGLTRGHVGDYDAFVVHLDETGAPLLAETFGGPGEDHVTSLARTKDGLIIAGRFQETIDFGGGPLTTTSSHGIFLAELTPEGDHLWSLGFTAGDSAPITRVAVDPKGDILLAGGADGALDFGLGAVDTEGGYDAFVVRFSSDGAPVWHRQIGGDGEEAFYDVVIHRNRDVVMSGAFSTETLSVFGNMHQSAGAMDGLLVRMDDEGTHLWSRRIGGSASDVASDVAVDAAGNIVVAGTFEGTVDFGQLVLTSFGERDVFVMSVGR